MDQSLPLMSGVCRGRNYVEGDSQQRCINCQQMFVLPLARC